jgi:hypothetical protein
MKEYSGFAALIADRHTLPDPAWIFVDKATNTEDAESLRNATYYVPENDDDEFDGEERLSTVVECPILLDILELREKNLPNPSLDQYLEALTHYLEYDDFLE